MPENKRVVKQVIKTTLLGGLLAAAAGLLWLSANRISLRSFTARATARAVFAKKRRWDSPEVFLPQKITILAGLAAGILGAGSALLLAPASGKELRNKLKAKIKQFRKHPDQFFINKNTLSKLKVPKPKTKKGKRKVTHHNLISN